MRQGAFDYMPKPFTPDQMRLVFERVARVRRLESQEADQEAQVRRNVPEADLRTEESAMRQGLDVAFRAAPSEAMALHRGESGTGMGVLAGAFHAQRLRADALFMTVYCPNLFVELLEIELFGHALGAFTGAVRETTGKVALAAGDARTALIRYPWPGNVRELRNVIVRAVILAMGSPLGLAALPAQVGAPPLSRPVEVGGAVALDPLEANHIRRMLAGSATL